MCRAIGGVDLVGDSWRPTVMALMKTSSAFCYSYQLMSSLYLLVANGAMASWLLTARIQDWRSAPSYLGLSFINLVQCALARPPLSASCHPYYRFVPADGMSGMHQSPWRTSSCTSSHSMPRARPLSKQHSHGTYPCTPARRRRPHVLTTCCALLLSMGCCYKFLSFSYQGHVPNIMKSFWII